MEIDPVDPMTQSKPRTRILNRAEFKEYHLESVPLSSQ
jgi:hypothetical protein